VSENWVLTIFGLKREEVTGGWRGMHNEELHNLYWFTNIVRMVTPRRMTSAGQIARMEEGECIQDTGGKERRKETTRKTKM
jgi:hypothetical protein